MNAPAATAPGSGRALAWTAYLFFVGGALMVWPAAPGALLALFGRRADRADPVDAHCRWLLRTFGGSVLVLLLGFALLAAAAWPLLQPVLAAGVVDRPDADWSLNIPWESVFAGAGIGTLGALVLFSGWCWYVYRVLRGALRLAARQAP